MNKRALFPLFVLVLAIFNIAAILRSEDPIRDTQTSPISYKQKVEEDKDGKKGPLAYSVKYNPENTFLTASPVDSKKETTTSVGKSEEVAPSATSWWEEVPAGDKSQEAGKDVEPAAEPVLKESLPESPQDSGTESAKEETPQGSKEDYWW